MRNRAITCLLLCVCLGSRVSAQSPSSAFQTPASWRYGSEQEWIVSDIVSSLAQLSSRARSKPIGNVHVSALPPAGTSPRFLVETAVGTSTLEIHDHIWAAANYIPLLTRWGLPRRPRSAPAATSGLLSALTTPRVPLLEASNIELQRRLSAATPGPQDYDDAALLLGVLALREGPGQFADVRHLLSKMTAYLAMAQARGGAAIKTDRVARIVQLALIERQRDVIDQLSAWERESPSALDRIWIRALRLRATGDWRLLDHPEAATLLERIEYVRALELRRGTSAVLEFLDASHPEDVADWARIGQFTMSVDASSRFTGGAIASELGDALYVWSKISGQVGTDEKAFAALIERLNDEPANGDSTALAPLDWPTWAGSFQRHITADIVAAVEHESWFERRREVARDVASTNEKLFGRLAMYPMAKLRYALDDVQYAEAIRESVTLMARRPEVVTPGRWIAALEGRNGRVPGGVTPLPMWFTTLVPAGTAYDADNRVYAYWKAQRLTLPALQGLRVVAPYSRYLLEEEMQWRYPRPSVPPLAEYQRAAGLMTEFDALALTGLANSAKASRSPLHAAGPLLRRVRTLSGCIRSRR